nr:hypothetical protein [Thalassospira xiamenensis]
MNQPVGTAQQTLHTGPQKTRRPVFGNSSVTIKHFGDFAMGSTGLPPIPGLEHHFPAKCASFGGIQGVWKLSGAIESAKPLQGERLFFQALHTGNDKSQTDWSLEKGTFGNHYLKMTVLVAQ